MNVLIHSFASLVNLFLIIHSVKIRQSAVHLIASTLFGWMVLPNKSVFSQSVLAAQEKKTNGNIEMQLLYLNRTYTWA